ncbi:hypothetical protein ACFLT6_00905 [Chloroflexota bacterium]
MASLNISPKSRRVVDELKKCGITHFVYLPDGGGGGSVLDILLDEGQVATIPVCREGEAFAIAAGLITGGKRPVVSVQNTGFLESGDSIRGIILNAKIPLLFLVGYRGWKKEGSLTDTAAIYLEPILKAWGIEYHLVENAENAGQIAAAYQKANDESIAIAMLITEDD